MNVTIPPFQTYTSPAGFRLTIGENGSVHHIESAGVRIPLHRASPLQAGGSNIYLRIRGEEILATPLLGPGSSSRFVNDGTGFVAVGEWKDLSYTCRLVLSPADTAWMWDVTITHGGDEPVGMDLLYVQDIGLTGAAGEPNELYVSQYIDHHELYDDRHGLLLCSRQVQHVPGRSPWLMLGSTGFVSSLLTDGLDFFGPAFRRTGIPQALMQSTFAGLRQGETAIAALQEGPFTLQPGETACRGFCALFRDDHPHRTTEADAAAFAPTLASFEQVALAEPAEPASTKSPLRSWFSTTPLLSGDDLSAAELDEHFGKTRLHAERQNGDLLSFFTDDSRHVVLRRKEELVDRPHVNIIQTGTNMLPDDRHFTSTSFMYGIFLSHAAQGNTCFNALLSTTNDPLNIYRYTGLRVFVTVNGKRYQLGVPSAWELSRHGSRWFYKHGSHLIQIRTWAVPDRPVLRLDIQCLAGGACAFTLTSHLDAANAWQPDIDSSGGEITFTPGIDSPVHGTFPGGRYRMTIDQPADVTSIGNDGALFDDGESRGLGFVVVTTRPVTAFGLSIAGELTEPVAEIGTADDATWDAAAAQTVVQERSLTRGLDLNLGNLASPDVVTGVREIIPWYLLNMQLHFLTPHGSEQPAGGAWGSRDVCQGPLELLLAGERYDEARGTLALVFANQQDDGDWPQGWAFDRYRHLRAQGSHGDIKFWPILALSQYIRASNDTAFLDETVPFCNRDGSSSDQMTTIAEHVDRTIATICDTFVPGTHLTAYEDGDWNDSMQPADPRLKERLTSAWTVALNYQAFRAYEEVCRHVGKESTAARLSELCERIRDDYNRYLVKDGTVAGYGIIEPSGAVTHLLHPTDNETGIHYRLLPMIRGVISGIFTPEQATHHLALIEEHLKGPDGARLMNRPPTYRGGETRYFQRAESSPFFGREIGLMYMHAHLRYAESQARAGEAERFLHALRQASPAGLTDLVPRSEPRQSNCYYSSSDAAFRSRYEVDEHYDDIHNGSVTFKGGWRIYSSGPGIYVGLILTRLLGLRTAFGSILFDPVMPRAFDGLDVTVQICGRPVTLHYHVIAATGGVTRIVVNGDDVPSTRIPTPYRTGGLMVDAAELAARLGNDATVKVEIG